MPANTPKMSSKTFDGWIKEAAEQSKGRNPDIEAVRYCTQQAYFNSSNLAESFWNFSLRISGRERDGLVKDRRYEFAEFVTDPHPYKMLQAARGSWKSSLAVVDYTAWSIGRDITLNGGESKIRILLASETELLAKRNMLGVRQLLEWREPLIQLIGKQRPAARTSKMWGKDKLVSALRRDARILEPTVSPIGRETEATGFHYDEIIADDLEAERSSANIDMIEGCWELYKLLQSIMHRGGKFFLVCTRWHPDDIYVRIEEQNKWLPDNQKIKVLKIPSDDGEGKEIGKLNFPNVLTKDELEGLREKQGTRIFNCQYRLRVSDDEDTKLKKEWIKYSTPKLLSQPGMNIYVTADFAWTEGKKQDFRKATKPDFTVVKTIAVDYKFRYIVIDWFRDRCSKRKAVEEIYRQYFEHSAILAVLQRYDRSQIADTIDNYGFEYGALISAEWIQYPGRQSKDDRIETVLAPSYEAGKWFIMPDMQWFINEEYMPFPKGKKDGLDCQCNVIHVASPAATKTFTPKQNPTQRRIKMLKAGTFDPDPNDDDWMNV